MSYDFAPMPDENGYFGEYGGQVIPPQLKEIMDDINDAYEQVRQTDTFKQELAALNADYTGRPSPIYFASRLTEQCGGAKIFMKREDLNHTGAHKVNNTVGQALLAKRMGKPYRCAQN